MNGIRWSRKDMNMKKLSCLFPLAGLLVAATASADLSLGFPRNLSGSWKVHRSTMLMAHDVDTGKIDLALVNPSLARMSFSGTVSSMDLDGSHPNEFAISAQ